MDEFAKVLAHAAAKVEVLFPTLDAGENFLIGRPFADGEIEEAPVT